MKKITAGLLILLFLVTQSGMALDAHWCGGKLTSVSFFSVGKELCKCGKKAMKRNCCKSKRAVLKIKNELSKISQLIFKPGSFICKSLQNNILDPASIFLHQKVVVAFYHSPPCKPRPLLYLLDKAFLI